MKTKTILAGVLLSGVLLSVGQTAQAEEAQGLSKNGTANVEITSGSTVITPEPTEPFPPTGPMLPVGDLGITSATDLYFDSIALSSTTTKREALYVKKDGTPISNIAAEGTTLADIPTDGSAYVPGYSVTDRRGSGNGWNLKLTLGDFVEQDVESGGTTHTLKGAKLYFPQVAPNTTPDAANSSQAPVTFEKTLDAGGSAQVLMSASKDTGMGLWEARYNSRALTLSDKTTTTVQAIELSVPGDNYAGKYQAILKWDLEDGPAATSAE